MKKYILISLAALAFVFTIALNINLSIDKNNNKLSGLTLENIEALALDEDGLVITVEIGVPDSEWDCIVFINGIKDRVHRDHKPAIF